MTNTKLKGVLVVGAVVFALATTLAKADNLDFTCSLSKTAQCSGTVIKSGSNYSSTGIDVFNDSGPYSASVPFILSFDTANDTISIDGSGIYAGQNLIGDITGFSVLTGKTTTDVSFTADWPTLPAAVQAMLGTHTGQDSGFVIYLTKGRQAGSPQSVDIVITPGPTPEPGSLILLGSGLVGLGGVLRKKLLSGKGTAAIQ